MLHPPPTIQTNVLSEELWQVNVSSSLVNKVSQEI